MNCTQWLNRGPYPVYIGFVPSEGAWKKTVKRIGCPNAPFPSTDGRAVTFESTKGKICVLVCIKKHNDPIEIAGLIAHEAMHVWQTILRTIGETAPGEECEAYAIQWLVQGLLEAYEKCYGSSE